MKKWSNTISWVALIVCLIPLRFSDVSKEGRWISQPAEVIVAMGEHEEHMFYHIKKTTHPPDEQSGEIVQKYGLMGGIDILDTLLTEKQGTLSFFADARRGKVKLLIEQVDTKEVVFYDFLTEKAQELSLEAGEYRFYLVGNTFSGKCQIAYQGRLLES